MVARWRNRTVAKGDSQVLPMLGGEVEEKKAGKCDLAASQSGWRVSPALRAARGSPAAVGLIVSCSSPIFSAAS
jgi:hypothetical protein